MNATASGVAPSTWETLWPKKEVDWSILWTPSKFHWTYGVTPFSQGAIPLFGVIAYLSTLYCVKQYMANRKPFKLHAISQAHNILLCAFSLVVLAGQLTDVFRRSQATGLVDLFCETRANPIRGGEYYWGYLYYISKYYDFFDTVLLAFKKRPMNFLHVYHHAIVPVAVWYGIVANFAMPVWTACIFNSAVHFIMYYYYYLAGTGARVWWKRYVTVFQLVQFCSGMLFAGLFAPMYFQNTRVVSDSKHFLMEYDKGCSGDLGALVFVGLVNISFLVLFARFYGRTYGAKTHKTE